jgi:hypothetical protein
MKNKVSTRQCIGVAAIVLGLAASTSTANERHCSTVARVQSTGTETGLRIADVWSGTTVVFDAIEHNGIVYFGYYDPDRWLSVAELNQSTGTICRNRLKSRFAGWDSHNNVVLAFDTAGGVHVAGNMHASRLVYGSAPPGDLSSLALRPMIGRNEESITYPTFVNRPDGRLLFVYRDGASGDGRWLVNAYDGETWHRLSDSAIFAASWEGRPTSAYPSAFRFLSDGFVHLAIVWRRTPDVATNYAITYTKTRDFVHWTTHQGRPVALPMTPGTSDPIEFPGEGQGLLNSARATLTPDGQPLLAYTRYDPGGHNVVILATPEGGSWRRRIVATAARRTDLSGGGTIPVAPDFPDPVFDEKGGGELDVAFPGEARRRIRFDPRTLNVTSAGGTLSVSPNRRWPKFVPPPDLVEEREMIRMVRRPDPGAGLRPGRASVGTFVYFAQGIHRDQPRRCTPDAPKACDPPPSPLIFFPKE